MRTEDPILDPTWTVEQVGMEDLVLAYMRQAPAAKRDRLGHFEDSAVIWLTWRQYRTQILVASGALVALAIILLVTGVGLAHLHDTSVATCKAHHDCTSAKAAFLQHYSTLQTTLGVPEVVVPGLVGVYWAAPLVARELETGTYRLAWTQSVTRTRWLAIKVGVMGLASIAVAGLLTLMVTWWSAPFDRIAMNSLGVFDERDIVPVAYAAFAFAMRTAVGRGTEKLQPCRGP